MIYLQIILRILYIAFNPSYLSLIILYFMVVVVHVISFTTTRARLSSLLYLLLFSRRMLVFLIFCSLLIECKLNFKSSLLLMLSIPRLQIITNPMHSFVLTNAIVPSLSMSLLIPSFLLILFSVRNIEMSFRN